MSPKQAGDERRMRGLELAKTVAIAETENGFFTMPSQSNKSVVYEVRAIGETWFALAQTLRIGLTR